MTEYYFVIRNTPSPMYEVHNFYEGGAQSSIFTFPKDPIPVLARYKPEEEYKITDIILHPSFSISKNTYDKINIQNIYGCNWIPLLLKDLGEHDFMMLQVASELDVIDIKKSKFDEMDEDNFIFGMTKLVLDDNKLNLIPLHKRLIFNDNRWGYYNFFHQSIVDLIMEEKPTGIEFVPTSTFDESWAG